MNFKETYINGVWEIELQPIGDERGSFARAVCQREFQQHGLEYNYVQANISQNKAKGTFRGLHLQKHPYEEAKLIRCTKGKILDLAVDLRENSNTYCKWVGVELSAENHKALYVPKGMAHGFITLEDDVEVFYMVSEYYKPQYENGYRHDDPAFQIQLPMDPVVISDKDRNWKDFEY